jgi:hypothetical protein
VIGYPGDTTLFTALQRNVNCYGNFLDAFPVSPSWSSDNPSVATIDASGLATAQGEGNTLIHASWEAITWYDTGNGNCWMSPTNAVVSALCDVLKECNPYFTSFDYDGKNFPAGTPVKLKVGDCAGNQDVKIVGNVLTLSGEPITEVLGGTCDDVGSNPKITDLTCTAMLGSYGLALVEIHFRAKHNPDNTQNASIHVELMVKCRNVPKTVIGGVSIRCPAVGEE